MTTPSHYMTSAQVGKRIGCQPEAVTARAKRRGIKPAQVVGSTFLWSPSQAKAIAQPLPTGRPTHRDQR